MIGSHQLLMTNFSAGSNEVVKIFNTSGSFTAPADVNSISLLLVGAGGAGSGSRGGGGGGGGVVYYETLAVYSWANDIHVP